MTEIFNLIEAKLADGTKSFNVKVSFLEIYNETIRDLICPKSENIELREDPVKGVCIAGVSEISV